MSIDNFSLSAIQGVISNPPPRKTTASRHVMDKNMFGFILLCVLTTEVLGVLVTKQSSTFNGRSGELALDGDPTTCSETGYVIGPWWKVDLGRTEMVNSVDINGMAGAFQIRVGAKYNAYENQGGFESNSLCVFSMGLEPQQPQRYHCKRPRAGRYVSIHVVDPNRFMQLRLCDVTVNF